MNNGMTEFESFTAAETAYRSRRCDGSCNGNSEICLHRFQWPCPGCGVIVSARGEDMLGYSSTEGHCLKCHIG